MKHFVAYGFVEGGITFSFPILAENSCHAVDIASRDELVKDMEFNKLIIEEIK